MFNIKTLEEHSKSLNLILSQSLERHKTRPIILFFSGGVDCLWIYAALKGIGHENFKLVHFIPEEIDPNKIRDFQNVKKFEKITGEKVEYIKYPVLDKTIHLKNTKRSNYGYFRTIEQFILDEKLFNQKEQLLIRGEDRRIHTPFLRYSDYVSHSRKFGLPYWRNSNRFKGEHILSSFWNQIVGKNSKNFKSKFGNSYDFKKMSYHQAHLILCAEIEKNQCYEDERISGLYGERDVIFPFSADDFLDYSIKVSEDVCNYLKRLSINEFYNQKIIIHLALKEYKISSEIINSKSTLETDHVEFHDFLLKEGFSEGTLLQRWNNYIEKIYQN